jgi:hypothetical protein
MAKASSAAFAGAKRRALRALGQQAPDSFVPDRVWFFNDELGFVVRLSNTSDDHHVQRLILWSEVEFCRIDIVECVVNRAVEALARAQLEN